MFGSVMNIPGFWIYLSRNIRKFRFLKIRCFFILEFESSIFPEYKKFSRGVFFLIFRAWAKKCGRALHIILLKKVKTLGFLVTLSKTRYFGTFANHQVSGNRFFYQSWYYYKSAIIWTWKLNLHWWCQHGNE